MLTADTITDEQIRELRDDPRILRVYGLTRSECECALDASDGELAAFARRIAREFCAEILNARAKEQP